MKKKTQLILLMTLFSFLLVVLIATDIVIYYYYLENLVLFYIVISGIILSFLGLFFSFRFIKPLQLLERLNQSKKDILEILHNYSLNEPSFKNDCYISAETKHEIHMNKVGIRIHQMKDWIPWTCVKEAKLKEIRYNSYNHILALELKVVYENRNAYVLLQASADAIYIVEKYGKTIDNMDLLSHDTVQLKEKDTKVFTSKKNILLIVGLNIFLLALSIIIWLSFDNVIIGLLVLVVFASPSWFSPKYSLVMHFNSQGISMHGVYSNLYMDWVDITTIHYSVEKNKVFFSTLYRYMSFPYSLSIDNAIKKYSTLDIIKIK